MNRAIFLDRDGTVVKHVELLSKVSQLRLLPRVGQAMRRINSLGFITVVETNQPVVARGIISPEEVEAIHLVLRRRLKRCGAVIDAFYFCPHHPEATKKKYRRRCRCRKPNPGMILRAARELNLDLRQSFMIGDALIDVVAGQRAGLRTILVKSGPGHIRLDRLYKSTTPEFTCQNLSEAVSVLENNA